jgi:hypothetical protein
MSMSLVRPSEASSWSDGRPPIERHHFHEKQPAAAAAAKQISDAKCSGASR